MCYLFVGPCHMLSCHCIGQLYTFSWFLNDILGVAWKSVPYFLGYKTEFFFSFQNNPKNQDPSYKMDLVHWNCSGRVKLLFEQNFRGLIKLYVVILEKQNPVL